MRAHLRAATMPYHARVDGLASRLDPGTRTGYAGLLSVHAAVLPGVERCLAAGPLPPDWAARGRSAALLDDLAALGAPLPAPVDPPALDSAAMRIGALYVIEGSRLGNEVLRRHVVAAWPEAPTAFLAHGAGARLWPSFVTWLDDQVQDARAVDEAVIGATQVFELYEQAFRDWLDLTQAASLAQA